MEEGKRNEDYHRVTFSEFMELMKEKKKNRPKRCGRKMDSTWNSFDPKTMKEPDRPSSEWASEHAMAVWSAILGGINLVCLMALYENISCGGDAGGLAAIFIVPILAIIGGILGYKELKKLGETGDQRAKLLAGFGVTAAVISFVICVIVFLITAVVIAIIASLATTATVVVIVNN